MTRPTPRRPASSRGGTQRPRKIAGQSATTPASPSRSSGEADDQSTVATDSDDRDGFLARMTTTRLLTIALAIASVVMVALGGVLLVQEVSGDDEAGGDGGVPKDRPVIAAELDVIDGVEAAAKAAQEIVAVNYEKFDGEVDAAAKLMTSDFEKDYRQTTEDVKKDIVGQKTVVQANVVAQGVVNANRTRLQALVFLNQVVTRTRDDKPETVVTPYKVLVTMVHTDKGWLVDGLDTDAQPQDKNN